MNFMMENSLVRLLFRNFQNLTPPMTSVNRNYGQKCPNIYLFNKQLNHENLPLDEFYDGELIGEVTFQKFPIFDRSNDVTKYELGTKSAQMYIYSINRVRSLKPFTQMNFMMENSLVRLLFRNFQNLTPPMTPLNLNQGQLGPNVYLFNKQLEA